jgi:hypothetical protein
MGSDWADVDNDGDIDLAIGNLGHPDQRGQYSNPSMIMRNEGTSAAPSFKKWDGVTFREMNAGMCFGDFDLDGKVDLYHGQISYEGYGVGADRPARFYLQGASRMEDHTWQTGLFIHGSWTGVRIDFDHDGDLDLLAASGTHEVRLFRNDLAKKGNSFTVVLRGPNPQSPKRVIDGSRVYVHTNAGVFMRQLPGTVIGGRCSQMSSYIHVGIGTADRVDSIVVVWPGDVRMALTDPAYLPNSAFELHWDPGVISGIERTTWGSPRQVSPQQHAAGVERRPTLRTASTSYAVRYQLYDKPVEDTTKAILDVTTANGEATVPQDLEVGKTYYWRVSYKTVSGGPRSGVWQFTVGAPQPKGTVITAPKQDEVVSNKTIVSWTRASFDSWQQPTVHYDVEIYRRSTRERVASVYNITDTTHTFDLEPNMMYVAVVRAKSDTTADPAWSEDRNFKTYGAAPSISLESPANGATGQPIRPRLTWHKHAWADKGYVVQYDVSNTFATATEKVRPDSVFPIISSLKPGTTYYWRVRGDNEAGQGAWSDVWSFTTTGTASVEEQGTSIHDGTAERFIAYDLLGKMLASGNVQDWDRVRSTLPSLPILMMTFASNGDVVERFLLPTP